MGGIPALLHVSLPCISLAKSIRVRGLARLWGPNCPPSIALGRGCAGSRPIDRFLNIGFHRAMPTHRFRPQLCWITLLALLSLGRLGRFRSCLRRSGCRLCLRFIVLHPVHHFPPRVSYPADLAHSMDLPDNPWTEGPGEVPGQARHHPGFGWTGSCVDPKVHG